MKNFIFLALILSFTTNNLLPAARKTKQDRDAQEQASDDAIRKARIARQNKERDDRAIRRAEQAATHEADECSICLGEKRGSLLTTKKAQKMLTCTHHNFHRTCLSKWLRTTRNTCPLCRKPGQVTQAPEESSIDFHQAARTGNITRILELLRTNPADINTQDESDRTPLHIAAAFGDLMIVQALTLAGADVEIPDLWGNTALYTAAIGGRTTCVVTLIHARADIDAQNDMGNTPLHGAARNHHIATLQVLLNAGADTFLPNHQGQIPAEVARTKEIAQLIRSY